MSLLQGLQDWDQTELDKSFAFVRMRRVVTVNIDEQAVSLNESTKLIEARLYFPGTSISQRKYLSHVYLILVLVRTEHEKYSSSQNCFAQEQESILVPVLIEF